MPATYHINREDEFVSVRVDGKVDLVEIYELCRALLADPDFSPMWPQLVDLRGIDIEIKTGAMRPFSTYLLRTCRPQFAAAPIAVVMDADRDSAFCAGVYRFTCGLGNAELFEDYAQAMTWLLHNGWDHSRRRAAAAAASLQPQDSHQNSAHENPE